MAPPKKISIIERRLQGPSALHTASQPIPLKEPGWTLRWENSEIRSDQIWHCINVLGWEYVTPDEVACGLDEIGANGVDQRVVRGERGKEVLLKMRTKDYAKVQKKKSDENIARTFDKTIVQNTVLNAVGTAHGSEAADFVQKSGFGVQDSRERVAVDE